MPRKTKEKPVEGPVEGMTIDEVLNTRSEKDILADKLVMIADRQIDASMKFKRSRMEEVSKSWDFYFGKTKKGLKGRYNVPLPIMSGFVDTLMSKIDDPPKINFGHQDLADLKRAKKVTAMWNQDSASSMPTGKWARKDRQVKKLAAFSGVGIFKYWASAGKKGQYTSNLEVVDYEDFECEPLGGQDTEKHLFVAQRNIFKTAHELKAGCHGSDPIYSRKQVLKLIAAAGSNDNKEFDKVYQEKFQRMWKLGLDPETNSYVGVATYNMTEHYMEWEGERYYILFEPKSKIWVRFEKLTDIFESNLYPFAVWHTHEDAFNFWSKAPADDMRPIADAMQVIFNQMLDNREKRNYGQRAFDPEMFNDPSQLEWRPDGLVEANTQGGVRPISEGIYEFKVGDMTEAGSINLMSFVDGLAGTKTGVSSAAQGESDDKKVGIYFGNLQQVADRLGLYNKSYSDGWADLGLRYYFGLKENLGSNKIAVQMMGADGYGWEEISIEDTETSRPLNIRITGGQAEVQQDEIKKKSRMDGLGLLLKSPTLAAKLNPDMTIEAVLSTSGWDDDEIRRFVDVQNFGSMELISEAKQAIEQIVKGKKPKMNRGATTGYMQAIIDYASDTEDLPQETHEALMNFAMEHEEIATYNMVRKLRLAQIAMMTGQGGGKASGVNGEMVPNMPGGGTPAGSPSGAAEDFSFVENPNLDKEVAKRGERAARMQRPQTI